MAWQRRIPLRRLAVRGLVAVLLAWPVPLCAASNEDPSLAGSSGAVRVDARGDAFALQVQPASRHGTREAISGIQVAKAAVTGRHCQDALSRSRTRILGNFAVLEATAALFAPNTSELMQSQVRALYDCRWLGRPGRGDIVVTVASCENATQQSLKSLARRYPVIIIKASPWPGNLAKMPGSAGVLRALIQVSRERGAPPRPTRVLITDCCDVVFRRDAACFGGGAGDTAQDLFGRFTDVFARHGKTVVFSSERGTNMLMSQDEYVARMNRAWAAQSQLEDPPVGWLVPIRKALRDKTAKSMQRKRHFSHKAAELPPSPLLRTTGTPDVCTELEGLCLHPKGFNTGLIMGELEPLAKVFEEAIQLCGEHCLLDGGHAARPSSDQNAVGHYLIASKFCGGRCIVDYNFTLFHTVQGTFGIYRVERRRRKGVGKKDPKLFIHITVRKAGSREVKTGDVLATKQWIALSPEVFGMDWFPVPACGLHAAGLPDAGVASTLKLLRKDLDLPSVSQETQPLWDTASTLPRAPSVGVLSEPQPQSKAVPLMRHG